MTVAEDRVELMKQMHKRILDPFVEHRRSDDLTIRTVRKALVPLVAAGVVALADVLGVKVPATEAEQLAAGVVTAVLVYAIPNS